LKQYLLLSLFIAFSLGLFAQATEPASQATNLRATAKTPFGFTLQFDRTSASAYLVLRSLNPITTPPVDGTHYQKGQGFGGGKVINVGNENSIVIKDVQAGTLYYFQVFACNVSGADINYRQIAPLADTIRSSFASPGPYYDAIDPSATSFVSQLHSLISFHTPMSYTDYRSNVVPTIFERDTTGGQCVVNCEYSGEYHLYTPPFAFGSGAGSYSKEHRMPRSFFPSGGTTSTAEGSDYHNLALTNQNDANGMRADWPYGLVESLDVAFIDGKRGLDSLGHTVYEPKDGAKGDAARAFFYMMVAYNGTGGSWARPGLASNGPQQNIALLKYWNQIDPVDAFELAKQEYIYTLQHNRNPFIDYPQWVDCIDFDLLQKSSACNAVVTQINTLSADVKLSLWPNPASEELLIEANLQNPRAAKVSVYDMMGRLMMQEELSDALEAEHHLNVSGLENGTYIFMLEDNNTRSTARFVIAR
jgi:endonuclease I